jgi:hypothetical protein
MLSTLAELSSSIGSKSGESGTETVGEAGVGVLSTVRISASWDVKDHQTAVFTYLCRQRHPQIRRVFPPRERLRQARPRAYHHRSPTYPLMIRVVVEMLTRNAQVV